MSKREYVRLSQEKVLKKSSTIAVISVQAPPTQLRDNWLPGATTRRSQLKRCFTFPAPSGSKREPRRTRDDSDIWKSQDRSRISSLGRRHMYTSQGMRRNIRHAAAVLVIIIVEFVVCRSPYAVSRMVMLFCLPCVPDVVHLINFWLGWLLSMLNPFLYAFICVAFRRYCVRLANSVKAMCKTIGHK